jgi:predicted alpha/beta superfamily hydrolase
MNLQQAQWYNYVLHRADPQPAGGTLKVLPEVWSPQLDNTRSVLVYLPPDYGTGSRHYPVIYMHDGQNLFDPSISYIGQVWRVDETMALLSREGLDAIVVGINHMGEQRMAEYNPFGPGRRGQRYIDFVADTLKPIIDRDFHTLPDRASTGIVGSSMGGLISLYAFFRRRDTFGFVGALSPALWPGHSAIYPIVQQSGLTPGRIYLDNGTREGSARQMWQLLIAQGYRDRRDVMYVVEQGGQHNEMAWARRLPDALRFLLRS